MGVHRYLHASRWNWWTQVAPVDAVVVAFNNLTGTNLTAIQTMVNSLRSAGLWDKLTDIYPFAGTTITSQAVNLKTPGTNSIAFKSGGTYGAGGMTPSGSGAASDMVSTPPLMVGANRSFSCGAYYSTTVVLNWATSIRLTNANGIFHTGADGNVYVEVFGGNQAMAFPIGATKMVSVSTGAGSQTAYRDGSTPLTAPITGNTGSTGVNAAIGSGSNSTFSVVFFGYNLTDAEQLSMYNICNTYNSSMGR